MHLDYDSATNTLRLSLDHEIQPPIERMMMFDGTIDVSTRGMLVGVEFRPPAASEMLRPWLEDPVAGEYTSIGPDGSAYIQMAIADNREARSATLQLQAEFDRDNHLVTLAIPRRGNGYEISYPSGNQ